MVEKSESERLSIQSSKAATGVYLDSSALAETLRPRTGK